MIANAGGIMSTMCYPAESSVLLLAYRGRNQTPSNCRLVSAIKSSMRMYAHQFRLVWNLSPKTANCSG